MQRCSCAPSSNFSPSSKFLQHSFSLLYDAKRLCNPAYLLYYFSLVVFSIWSHSQPLCDTFVLQIPFTLTVGALLSSALNVPAIYAINHDASTASDIQYYTNEHSLTAYSTEGHKPWPCSARKKYFSRIRLALLTAFLMPSIMPSRTPSNSQES